MIKPKIKHSQFAKQVVKTLTKGGTQTEAYMKVYPEASKQSAIDRASRLMAKPHVKQEIALILDKNNMNRDKACKKLKRLMNAKKPMLVDKQLVEVQDNPTQLEATKTVLKLHGELKTGVNITEDNRQVNIGTDSIDHRQLKTLTDKLNSLHRLMNKAGTGEQDGEVDLSGGFDAGDDTLGVEDGVFLDTAQMDGGETESGVGA